MITADDCRNVARHSRTKLVRASDPELCRDLAQLAQVYEDLAELVEKHKEVYPLIAATTGGA
jgi:hypothetical protein